MQEVPFNILMKVFTRQIPYYSDKFIQNHLNSAYISISLIYMNLY